MINGIVTAKCLINFSRWEFLCKNYPAIENTPMTINPSAAGGGWVSQTQGDGTGEELALQLVQGLNARKTRCGHFFRDKFVIGTML